MSELGRYLKEARVRLGLSLREAQDRSNVSNAYISLIESGRRIDPHPNILKKLADAYKLELQDVMRVAGYLDFDAREKEEDETAEVEHFYSAALADPAFDFGRRSKQKVDFVTKKLIAEMYKKLKAKK